MAAAAQLLRDRILEELRRSPGQKAVELADALQCDRREVTQCLSFDLAGLVRQESDYRWYLVDASRVRAPVARRRTTEIARLCAYFLECISQDMDEGASAFAKDTSGDQKYASLGSVPLGADSEWWLSPDVGRLLGKVRADRGKLSLWLGYPVRLRYHRTARWEGHFVEPALLWPIVLPAEGVQAPAIDEQNPIINPKFLRPMALGGGLQLAEEMARLSDELGLGAPAEDLPDIEELAERLVRIRPDWDWREDLDPANCPDLPRLADISAAGIYNRALIIPGERSPYTFGLEAELKALGETDSAKLGGTALDRWLSPDVALPTTARPDDKPLLEVLPMNTEQRAAVDAALTESLTVITGPPGTGKSQVVTNLLVNAAWRGMKVLFASKNNKAVDVVEDRVNGLTTRPVLLRMGTKEYQATLASHLTKMLTGNPGPEVAATFEEGLERYRALGRRLLELGEKQQKTLARRNLVDRLEAEAEDARRVLGAAFGKVSAAVLDRALADLQALIEALDRADRDRQPFIMRALWGIVHQGRSQRLAEVVRQARPTMEALGSPWPAWKPGGEVSALREQLATLQGRAHAAAKAVRYRTALHDLQAGLSFEEIARQRTALAMELGENSQSLWRNWVELGPTRLEPQARKEVADYAAVLQVITSSDGKLVHSSTKQRARVLQSQVTGIFSCWAVTSLSARGRIPMEPGYFDLVVIDEASQCDIASALPLLYRAKRSVVIGDPMQLRHISALSKPRDSELQHKHGLVDTRVGWMYSVSSLFDAALGVTSPKAIISLRDHHRSHADIIGFSNEAFYEGRLRIATRYDRLKRPSASQPGVVWQSVSGRVERPVGGGARNAAEAAAVADAVTDLLVARGYTGTVGVVTPFRAQAQLLQAELRARPALEKVSGRAELLVDTVHSFQGDERDVMFFSPVVSKGMPNGALEFLRHNGNLFNVAITRARGLLHVVGDRGAAASCGVTYLERFAEYVSGLDRDRPPPEPTSSIISPEYPTVARPERVSDWERHLYRAMVAAGLKPLPQLRVEQYDLDFALLAGGRRLAIEVDGERYHRSWTGELCLKDQLRNQRLIELGWDVRRFWVYEIRDDLERCLQVMKDWVASAEQGVPAPQ